MCKFVLQNKFTLFFITNKIEMNKFKILAIALSAFALSSCSDDENDYSVQVPFYNADLKFNSEGVWENVYSPSGDTPITFGDFIFSHYGESGTYDYFYGFVPSKSKKTTEYTTTSEWLNHQWSTIAGTGLYEGMPYLVGYWDSYVDGDELIPDNPSCSIKKADNSTFRPTGILVSNTTWGYYSMRNGSEMYPTPFGNDDSCELIIYGTKRDMPTGKVTVELAKGKVIANKWIPVYLNSLGEVDMIYFQMKSTVTNEYGICNPPTSFCIDGFFVE